MVSSAAVKSTMKLVIKVGSQQLICPNNSVNMAVISALVQQLVQLIDLGHQPVLVSSGAVASGREMAKRHRLKAANGLHPEDKQWLAAIGQVALMNAYGEALQRYQLLPAQLLLSHQDFTNRRHYLNVQNVFVQLLAQKRVLAIVNENDSVAIEELMFTDNDQLAFLVAAMLGADKLIFLTNVDGIYLTPPPAQPHQLIKTLAAEQNPTIGIGSALGRGGMASKISSARRAAKLGITAHIANVNQQNVLLKIAEQEQPPGTTVLSEKQSSSVKRWLAVALNQQKGSILVNRQLSELLQQSNEARSILPVGISCYSGEFSRGDVVMVANEQGQRLGVGMANYSSKILESLLGRKGERYFIHYNYLYLD